MSISFTRYIDITSGVGAPTVVGTKELIARIFTENPLLPTKSFIEFTTIAQVGAYFGTTSAEYARAAFYFAFISKKITSPQKISFARWTNAATAPLIFGGKLTATLSQLQAITNGAFALTMGGFTFTISGLNFSADGSLAAVAATIQSAIQAESGGGALWTSATVVYDSTRGSFDLTGGATGVAPISVASPGSGTDITTTIAWTVASGAIWSNGETAETLTQTLTISAAASDNFGSFCFIPVLSSTQAVEVATWNVGQNVAFQYQLQVNETNFSTYATALAGIGGTGINYQLSTITNQFIELAPMALLASIDYSQPNSVVNFMFTQFNLTPSVTDDTTANTLDALSINYYGETQTAGQQVSFYQRGFLQGGATDPLDMNVYGNEQWLKSALAAQLMNLLLALTQIPANNQGIAQVSAALNTVIQQALLNGTISIGKTLTTAQQLFITQVSNSPTAWYIVQTNGFWLNAVVQQYQDINNVTQFKIVYTLIYSKNDVIRLITGTDILI